jgi:RecB family exonuclease
MTTISHEVTRGAQRLADLLATVREAHAGGATAEEVLWTAWEGSRVADDWRRAALGSGLAADEANRALDGVVALFTAARRFVERTPSATADEFLADILDSEVPEDTLAPLPDGEAVLVITPSAATGFQFDTVVVAGLQEGAWPNLRVRGSLLGAPQLVAAVTGQADRDIDERRIVLDDELRIFALAVSRARSRLILAAIDSDDETPSAFFDLATARASAVPPDPTPLTLRGMTGRLRRVLTAERAGRDGVVRAAFDDDDRASAASVLRSFAVAEVPGSDPSSWRGLDAVSTEAPIYDLSDPEQRIPVSPSRLEEVERSPMEWFVSHIAGGGSGLAANLGTLLHDVMEHADTTDPDVLWQTLLERWHELAFDAPWHGEMQRVVARRWVDALSAYLTHFLRDGAVLVSAEGEFRLDIAPAVLSGKIDRVESRDGAILIVDLKTGSVKSVEEAADHPQLGAYQVAYADGAILNLPDGHRPGGAALLFTKQGSGRGNARVPYTVRIQEAFDELQLETFRTRVRTAAGHMLGPVLRAAMIDDPYAYGGDLRRVHLPGEVSGD